MNKYLIDIFKLRKSVTLPGFGALMIANSKTGKMVINKFVKFDDGVLAKFIAEKEGIDLTEAKNLVAKFVKEIKTEVEKGGTYDIYEFGSISKNEKDEFIFTSVNEGNTKLNVNDKIKTEDKKTENEAKTKSKNVFIPNTKDEAKVVKDKITKTKESISDKTKEIADKTANSVSDKTKKNTDKTKTVLESNKNKTVSSIKENTKKATTSTKNKTNEKLAAASATVVSSSEKVTKKVVEKKKKRRLIPLLLLLGLLGGIAFLGYKFQNEIKAKLGIGTVASTHHDGETAEEHSTHTDEINNVKANEHDNESINKNGEDVISDSLNAEGDLANIDGAENNEKTDKKNETLNNDSHSNSTDNNVTEDVNTSPEPEVTNVQTSINGSYHIVGGAFGEKSNADNYASKNGGTVLGKFDGLYLVALKSYNSRADAQADLSNVKSTSSSAWIFKYSK